MKQYRAVIVCDHGSSYSECNRRSPHRDVLDFSVSTHYDDAKEQGWDTMEHRHGWGGVDHHVEIQLRIVSDWEDEED